MHYVSNFRDMENGQIVDDQNKNDSNYEKMSKNFEKSIAFKTACI